jgi:hypothetical protein
MCGHYSHDEVQAHVLTVAIGHRLSAIGYRLSAEQSCRQLIADSR